MCEVKIKADNCNCNACAHWEICNKLSETEYAVKQIHEQFSSREAPLVIKVECTHYFPLYELEAAGLIQERTDKNDTRPF